MENLKFKIIKLSKILLIGFFLIICTLPLVQMKFKLLPEAAFEGVETKGEFPKFSWTSFYQDKYQQEIATWLAANIGFRPWLVRLDNQFAFSLFNHVNTKYGTGIVLGKKNYIYEQQYVDAYLGKNYQGDSQLAETVSKLNSLKTKLSKHGVELLLVLGGSKVTYFPENLPEEYQQQKPKISNFQKLLELLQQTDINYVDTTKPLLDRKKAAEYPLYPKSGTHWSYYGGCILAEEIVRKLNQIFSKQLPPAYCTKLKVSDRPLGNDADIAGVTNIWFPDVFNDPQLAYPRKSKQIKPEGYRPDILFIGDSFSWHILQYLRAFRLYQNLDFYFYAKTMIRHSFPRKDRNHGFFYELPRESIDLKNLDFQKEVLEKDLLILQANESTVELLGYDFIDYALQELNRLDNQS